MNQENLEDAQKKITHLVANNARKDIVELARGFRRQGVWDPLLIQSELVAWLELGKFQRAKNVYQRCKNKCDLPESFVTAFQRYTQYQSLAPRAEDLVVTTVRNVRDFIIARNLFATLLERLRPCSDFILISNSSSLFFSQSEKEKLLAMKCPLFVYLNIGNPLLTRRRNEFYGTSFMELVVGGFQHIFDADGRMIFTPMDQSSFLGCLLRVNQKFRSRWSTEFDPLIRKQNYDLDFDLIACQDKILDLYKVDLPSFSRDLIPTIGWIALALFDAFSMILAGRPRLWVAGFDLSPSYIFETCNINWRHDFALEKAALEFRLANKSMRSIGSVKSTEVKAPTHMHLAGMSSLKLSDRINGVL